MLSVVGTVAFDTLAQTKALASPEATGGVTSLQPDLPGGTGGNVAMALARLGMPPRLLSAVGPDFAGCPYEKLLVSAGVSLDDLVRAPDTPTSRAYIFVEPGGRQVTYFYPGASRQFRALRPLRGRVHFCAGEISGYPDLMAQADWVSFDPGQEVFHRDLDQILACLPHVDLLFLNRHELEILEQRTGWALPRFFAAGVQALVETRGGEGSVVHTRSGRFAAPAVPVGAVLDPTGAGDAHRAGFLYALERGAEMGVAARFASVLGSFAVEAWGAQAGHPTLAQALERHQKAFNERPFA